MNATQYSMYVGVVGLGEGLSTAVSAYPSKAGATVGCVGLVVSVSLSRFFLSPRKLHPLLKEAAQNSESR